MTRHTECKAERVLRQIQRNVGGVICKSKSQTPHLVVGGVGGLSVVYFGKTRSLRVFTQYMKFNLKQELFDFKQWPEVKRFVEDWLAFKAISKISVDEAFSCNQL